MPEKTDSEKPADEIGSGGSSPEETVAVPSTEPAANTSDGKVAEETDPIGPAVSATPSVDKGKATKAAQQLKRLRKSIGMAMPSNRFRVFLGHGAIPPVTEKKHFVAKLRNLDRIEVVILEGDDDQADNNQFVGEIGLGNVKLRNDGRAEIEIDFTLEDNGSLSVIILDRIGGGEATGKFMLPQFSAEIGGKSDMGALPAEELSQKIDLLEQQMQLLKGELFVRRERDSSDPENSV